MQQKRHSKLRGFSFVELLIVVAVIGVLASLALGTFTNMGSAAALRVAVQEAYSAISDARNNTLASQDDSRYGAHIASTSVTRFVGTLFDPSDPSNETYYFERNVTATSSLFRNGSTTIVFSRLSGESSASGTIFFRNADMTSTTSITVYTSGLIES